MTATLRSSTNELAALLDQEPAVQTLRDARAALEADQQACNLIEHFQRTYRQLAAKQHSGEVLTDEEAAGYHDLQARVQRNPTVQRLADAEQEATVMLTAVAATIDEHSGVNFTSLAVRGGC